MDTDFSNRRLSYPERLFLWLLGYSVLLVGCFVFFQYHREKEFKAEELNSQLQLVNAYILAELEEGKDIKELELARLHPFEDLRISVISEEGDVIYDNALDSLRRTNHRDREEIKEALKYNTGYAVRRHSTSTGENYFYSARRGNDGSIVRSAVPYSLPLDELLKADYGFLWVMGAVSIVMCVLGYFATRRVGQHITRLKQFAGKVEKGEKISDNEPFPHDELGDISNHIVRLYSCLQQSNAERDSEHRAALREHREKERIKKQLTNNINHELKTPVASIQVCVETMLAHMDMKEEMRRVFLNRCLSSTERLRRLLADVSLITRMDDGGNAIVRESMNLTAAISESIANLTPLAESKGISIDCRIDSDIVMKGNPSLIESVFSNLIHNAIAYSGGSLIKIGITDLSKDTVILYFNDNGTGIAEEHLPHIFERFYRIDKGRSRAAGGTGLGLSIVKNAVLIHGGKISVANLKDGGLGFTISFPYTEMK